MPKEEENFITRAQGVAQNGQDKPEVWVDYKSLVIMLSS